MRGALKTIEIDNPDGKGKLVINEADFDPNIHTEFGKTPKATDEMPAPAKKAAKKAAKNKA